MKAIHCADLHLGSLIESKCKPIKEEMIRVQMKDFSDLIQYAKANNISLILLSGDVFDNESPFEKISDYFYSLVERNKDIDFLFLRGNHDLLLKERVYPNLKTFQDRWITYSYGNVDISGIELTKENEVTFYQDLNLDKDKMNIVMLHGQISSSLKEGEIHLENLKNRNIDYLALGHVHSFSEGNIDERGKYCYPGCLEGRGFDECGKKGFVLLDIEDTISYKFIPFSKHVIHDEKVDISGCDSIPDIVERVKEKIFFQKEDIYRITLIGEVAYDVLFDEKDIQNSLANLCFFLLIEKRTKIKIDASVYLNEISLKGEFARKVLKDDSLSKGQKEKIPSIGLKALQGKE